MLSWTCQIRTQPSFRVHEVLQEDIGSTRLAAAHSGMPVLNRWFDQLALSEPRGVRK